MVSRRFSRWLPTAILTMLAAAQGCDGSSGTEGATEGGGGADGPGGGASSATAGGGAAGGTGGTDAGGAGDTGSTGTGTGGAGDTGGTGTSAGGAGDTGSPGTGAGGAGDTGGTGTGAGAGGGGAGGSMECVPLDDGNPCTVDVCTPDGATAHAASPAGAPCAAGGVVCDGRGQCVACLDDTHCTPPMLCDTASSACVEPDCADGALNGDESDVDCGGAECVKCVDGKQCVDGADCASGVCSGLVCAAPACGDGVVNGADGCDDGNGVDGDGCDGNCKPTGCGNGFLSPGEGCDDGNVASGDGCDNNCQPTGCGNGVVTAGEICDDGNPISGDGCDANCTITSCGNGVVTAGEQCDDGNGANGDGCDANCTVTACGNGVATAGEQCDDGNPISGDGCDVNCTVTACGNGIKTPGEGCDDGNNQLGDGCSSLCWVEPGHHCEGTTPTVCALPEVVCNDGVDNNGKLGTDAADPTCQLPAYFPPCGAGQLLRVYSNHEAKTIPLNFAPGVTTNVSVVGAGLIARAAIVFDIEETHDEELSLSLVKPGGAKIDVCSGNGVHLSGLDSFESTVLSPDCAGSVVYGAEPYSACYAPENAGQVGALALTPADGTWGFNVAHSGWALHGTLNSWTLALCTTACGDGVVVSPEQCDDGNTTSGDGCDSNCTPTACGNNLVTAGEQCDDGNTTSGDGCDADCSVTACGNGIPTAGEQCDDGNKASGDGCSATCQIEAGYQCTPTAPAACARQEVLCSNGADDDGDGHTDAADPDCALPAYFPGCGGGVLRVYKSVHAPAPIPDGDVTGVASTISVKGAGGLQRVALVHDITHPYVSDIDIHLQAPDGYKREMCTDNGGSGDNFTNALLDDACSWSVTNGIAPFNYCYKPELSLAAFNGGAVNGLWTLLVADDQASSTGAFLGWTLVLCTSI